MRSLADWRATLKRAMRGLLRFLFWVLVVAAVSVGLARATAIRWWRVPSNDPYLQASIAPTLRGGDLIVLWRFSKPHFGDLVMCPEPNAPDRTVIARVAGIGGETVELRGSTVHVNRRRANSEGRCFEDKFSVEDPQTHSIVEQSCDMEELGSRVHERGQIVGQAQRPDYKTAVENGHFFLLSDNRHFPYDSRDFGTVDAKTCRETVIFRLVSAQGFSHVASRLTWIR